MFLGIWASCVENLNLNVLNSIILHKLGKKTCTIRNMGMSAAHKIPCTTYGLATRKQLHNLFFNWHRPIIYWKFAWNCLRGWDWLTINFRCVKVGVPSIRLWYLDSKTILKSFRIFHLELLLQLIDCMAYWS